MAIDVDLSHTVNVHVDGAVRQVISTQTTLGAALTEAVSINSPYKSKAQETLNKIGGSTAGKGTHKSS